MKLFTFERKMTEAISEKETAGHKVDCSVEGSRYIAKASDGTVIVGDFANLTITITHD